MHWMAPASRVRVPSITEWWAETGLEEMHSDLLQADFWLARSRHCETFVLPWHAGGICFSLLSEKSLQRYYPRAARTKFEPRSTQSIRRDLLFPTMLAGGFLVAASLVE